VRGCGGKRGYGGGWPKLAGIAEIGGHGWREIHGGGEIQGGAAAKRCLRDREGRGTAGAGGLRGRTVHHECGRLQ
jgi:hypothetical protein